MLNVERDGDVVTLTIDRPERRNALHGPLWSALKEAADALYAEPPRAVILTGVGEHFCAGMDLKMDNPLIARLAPAVAEKDEAALRALIVELKGVVDAIANIPAPVVAAIEGACAGGGLELALACDLRVAARGAFFSLPETHLGMVPDVGGTVRATRLVGAGRATELILSGRRLDVDEAERWGLVNRVVDAGGALAQAQALVKELCGAGPACARSILEVLRANAPTFEQETEAGVRALTSGEVMEGAMAFAEKRPPKWLA
ncbi:MAG: enoyl-CoA hydratase/isomerase family protein [Deltaproteobacteria bacterium]|jgi:enoyl-CoA hydratase/carnithine racemase